ncbi:MAG: peroxiredoxin [Candidatus Korobacteraceae bacterium]
MKGMFRITCVVALLLALAGVAVAAELQVGSEAPNFTLSNQEGKQISLNNLRGKWVVLYFYPKDFTQGCTIEARGFQRDQAEYLARNAEVLGVSLDSADSHKKFCEAEGLTFTLLADPTREVAEKYNSLNVARGVAQRNTFVIDPKGKVAKVFLGVNPNKHSEEVIAMLEEVGAKKK